MRHSRNTMIIIIGSIVAMGPLATDIYLPSLPGLGLAFDTSVKSVQLTLSAYLFGYSVAQVFCGPLSDRYGRLPIMLGGLILFAASSVICTWTQTIDQLIFARFFQAIGGCVGPVLGRAMVRDMYDGEEATRVQSWTGVVLGISPAVAPIVGGYLEYYYNWTACFYVLSIYAVASVVVVWLFVGETNHSLNPTAAAIRPMMINFSALLKHRSFVGHTLTLTLCFGGLWAWLSGSPFVLTEVFGIPAKHLGFCYIWGVATFMMGSAVSARFGASWGVHRSLQIAGLCAISGSGSALMLELIDLNSIYTLIGTLSVFFFAGGIVFPQTISAALQSFPKMAGSASGLLGFMQMSGGALIGGIVGHIYNGSADGVLWVMFFCAVGTLLSHQCVTCRFGRSSWGKI